MLDGMNRLTLPPIVIPGKMYAVTTSVAGASRNARAPARMAAIAPIDADRMFDSLRWWF
jgi:hypothetical protein